MYQKKKQFQQTVLHPMICQILVWMTCSHGFESDIPLLESNERLKKMITAPPEILENIANNILQEIGKNTVFVFSEAKSLFLFWKGNLENLFL